MKSVCLNIAFAILTIFAITFAQEGSPVYNAAVKSVKVLDTDTTSIGQHIVYPVVKDAEVTGLRVTIPPHSETGWHKHTVSGYAYVMKGVLTIETKDGKDRTFSAGSSFVEMVDTLHNGKNNATEDVELIVFFPGEKGVPFTLKK